MRRDDETSGNGYYVVTTSDGSLWAYEENVGWSQRPGANKTTQVAAYRRPGGAYLEAYAQIPPCA